jgi:aminopeptidase N
VRRTITDPALDRSFVAEAVRLPSEAYLGDQMQVVDPDAIHAARESLMGEIGRRLESEWRTIHADCARNGFSLSPDARAARKLRGVALSYVVASGAGDGAALAFDQFDRADNMTERQAALAVLANGASDERDAALARFYDRYAGNALVIDKWFQTQAFAFHPDTVEIVEALGQHPDFTLSNPNRARSLFGAFAGNQWAFHRKDGKGYAMVADTIIALDKLNPQTAARLVPPLGRWRRFDPARGALMRAALERIAATPNLSKDVLEQATKSLA